jgi:hypothetical protein
MEVPLLDIGVWYTVNAKLIIGLIFYAETVNSVDIWDWYWQNFYAAHRRVSHMQGFSTLYNIGKLILFFMVQYLSHIGKIV